jgi:hypothetical protein
MPKALDPQYGLKFFFYSREHLPIHIHVRKEGVESKWQVGPTIELIENAGMKFADLRKAHDVIEENKAEIIKKWNDFFKYNI